MQAHWRVWTDATSEKSVRNVATRLLRQLARPAEQLDFAPYPKTGGWTFSFRTQLAGASWNDYVVDVITLGQRVGHGWIWSDDVTRQLDGWSNTSRISGVTNVQWQIWAPRDPDVVEASTADE